MKHSRLMIFVAVAGLLALPLLAQAQLLKGKLVNIKEDIALNYAPDGNIMFSQYHDLKVADDGKVTLCF